MLKVENVNYSIGKKQLLHPCSALFATGLFHVILGPNGSGKSTFLKILGGELKPLKGKILYGNQDIHSISKLELARKRAVMSQQIELHFPLSVYEIVLMGRYPYFNFKPSASDEQICQEVMEQMEIKELKDRNYLTLSGGEKQRVQFTRVLAQLHNTNEKHNQILLLDEAVSNLDIKYQHFVLLEAKKLCKKGITVICILHDINLALQYANRLLLMKEGKILYDLETIQQLTANTIKEVFDVEALISTFENGQQWVIPYL